MVELIWHAIEIFYRKFLRIVLFLNKSCANCIVYGEVGKLPLKTQIEKRLLTYWVRVSGSKDSKFSHTLFNLQLKLHQRSEIKFDWFTKIESILNCCGQNSDLLDISDQDNFAKQIIKHELYTTLVDLAIQEWHAQLSVNSNCNIYSILKTNFHFENYLVHLNTFDRINMTKFRTSNNRLPANRFSANNNDKICNLCDNADFGDEYHYLFICNHFQTERDLYLSQYFRARPNTLKMQTLFESTNNKKPNKS